MLRSGGEHPGQRQTSGSDQLAPDFPIRRRIVAGQRREHALLVHPVYGPPGGRDQIVSAPVVSVLQQEDAAGQQAGRVVASGQVGQVGKAFWGAYGVSKFGIEGLTRILAAELENTRIRVNCIDPGPTRTALRRRVFPAEDSGALKTPEVLAPLYLWAMGPDSRGTTGQRLTWDD